MSDGDFASNCPISRPIRVEGITVTQFFNGVGFSPDIGFVYDVTSDTQDPLEPPAPGAGP